MEPSQIERINYRKRMICSWEYWGHVNIVCSVGQDWMKVDWYFGVFNLLSAWMVKTFHKSCTFLQASGYLPLSKALLKPELWLINTEWRNTFERNGLRGPNNFNWFHTLSDHANLLFCYSNKTILILLSTIIYI